MSVFQILIIRRLRTLGSLLLATLPFIRSSVRTQSEELILTPEPEEVTFLSGKLVLHGFIHQPKGKGPFPAIVMNYGSEQFPASMQKIAQPFISRGYVVFVPVKKCGEMKCSHSLI